MQYMERTAVYRIFDGSGALLYVGVTYDMAGRMAAHYAGKDWFHSVARIEIEWYATRADALAAERRAIQVEHPARNIVRMKGRTPTTTFRIPPDILNAARQRAKDRQEPLTDALVRGLRKYVDAP